MQDMAKLIHQLGYRHNAYQVFADFVEVSAIAFSNAVDKPQFDKREQRYFDIIKRYDKDELQQFPKLLGMLTNHLEGGFDDVLGNLYHHLEIHNERSGQYFTPYPICQMMAKLQVNQGLQDIIDKKGYVSASDPACGSGAMVVALADEMYQQKINYQQTLHATVVDLDPRCVHMAYVQFSLLNIPAVVVHGNSLSLEEFSHWHTPAHVLGGWPQKMERQKRFEQFQELLQVTVADTPKTAKEQPRPSPAPIEPMPPMPNVAAGTQLKLF